jgi:hypothetical protein
MAALGLVDRADRVPEARRAMNLGDGRPLGGAGVPVRRHDRDRLLEGQDVVQRREVAERVQEALLHGARVPEDVRDAVGDELLEDGVPAGFDTGGRRTARCHGHR